MMDSNTILKSHYKSLLPVSIVCIFLLIGSFSTSSFGEDRGRTEKAPPSVVDAVAAGQQQDILVLFDDSAR